MTRLRLALTEPVAATMLRLLENARYEVMPTPSVERAVLDHVPQDRVITVTASPSRGLEPSLALTERLTTAGYVVVPHLAARMVRDKTELAAIVDRLTAVGVERIFVPGGDAQLPRGRYLDALSLLEDLSALGRPISHVGITGYPESHPTIHDDVLVQAMWDKRRHATHVVSNLAFDSAVISGWVQRLRARGVTLPVLLGMPGPVERTKLIGMAAKIGVGESARFLAKNKGLFARLTAPGGFTGERFLAGCSVALGQPWAQIEGLHVFTFNQVAATEAWRHNLLAELRRRVG